MAETEQRAARWGQWQRSEGGEGTHWSEDEGGDWGSVGEALRAVWVVGSVGGGGVPV